MERIEKRQDVAESLLREVLVLLTNFKAEFNEFRQFVTTNMVTRAEFDSRFETFTRDIEASRQDRARASDLYMDHEARISRLEGKKA